MRFHLQQDQLSEVTGVHLVRQSSIETTHSFSQLCSCHLTDYNLPKFQWSSLSQLTQLNWGMCCCSERGVGRWFKETHIHYQVLHGKELRQFRGHIV